jgi:AmiR/NasT family two-component response regulator
MPAMTRSVLLVDPETDRQTRMLQSLDGTDFRVAAAVTDPGDALRLAATTSPDVALVATTFGNGMGLHVTERLPKEHKVPVVLLASGSLDTTSMKLAAQAGVMGFLVEPILSVTLQTTLEVAVCRFQELCSLQQETETLRQSVEARKVIERAKGLLMEVGRMSEREAYARIRRKSMDTQRPMAEIARAIILSAEVTLKAG